MPFIDVKVAGPVSAEKKEAVKTALGGSITALHKSETYLMVGMKDNYDLWMAGEKLEKGAYVSVSLFGSASEEDYSRLTGHICDMLQRELEIPGKSVYVTYHPISDWGWNGSNF